MYNYPPYPPMINMNNQPEDEIVRLEKMVHFLKRLKDEDKDRREEQHKKDDRRQHRFGTIEWFMMLMVTSSVIQTVLILWLIRGR